LGGTGTTLDISGVTQGSATVGSVEGSGSVLLGGKQLTTGANNLSTTLSGAISGSGGSLGKQGTGPLTLAGKNTYTRTTTGSAGTLQIGNGGTTGTLGSGNVTNQGVVAVNRSDTYTYDGIIGGTGQFQQTGTGTTILTGTNAYGGMTVISAGTLQIG